MAHTVHLLACFVTLLFVSSAKDQSRWSRQISTYTSDMSDWVPLTAPIEREPLPPSQIKRQAIAEPRILTESFPGLTRPTGFSQEAFPSRSYYNTPSNRQLYLQSMPSVPSAPQNYLTDQGFGQSIRFGLSQANFPLNQGFITPQFGYESISQVKTRPQTIPSSPIKFESFQTPVSPQLSMSLQAKPFKNQVPKLKPDIPKFIDGYRAENSTNEFAYNQKKKPQSLQKIKFENFDKSPKSELLPQNNPKVEREEVQLLYVPLESLNRGQFNFRSPMTASELINSELYSQGMQRPNPQKQSFGTDFQTPLQKPLVNFSPQDYLSDFNAQLKDFGPTLSTGTTPPTTLPPITHKPKKLKPHQPPLAIFLTEEASRSNQIKVGDVLSSLKTANTIAVLDAVNPLNAPKVFIGPSNLHSPENYVKFELPYLSNIENSDKKLRQLPFFVAPLSYNTPQGFAKIPFPSPHVGSVVINSQIKETTQSVDGPSTANIKPNYYIGTYKQEQRPVTQKPTISFESTVSPKATTPSDYKSNYYSFEPQVVSSLRTTKQPDAVTPPLKTGSYFLSNIGDQYHQPQFADYSHQDNYNGLAPVKPTISSHYYSTVPTKQTEATTTTTMRTTITTPTKPQSIYSSQLLETHNPYSINHAFHFSTPLDYHNDFEEYKEIHPSPGPAEHNPPITQPPTTVVTAPSSSPQPSQEIGTEKQNYQQQTSVNYLQNYTPEVHYESEVQNSRYPVYNSNEYTTKTESNSEQTHNPINTDYSVNPVNANPTEYSEKQEVQAPILNENLTENIQDLPTISDVDIPPNYEYNQYETSYNSGESKTTTTTTSTTTRRPLRSRGRPRYTTSKPDSNESSTRALITRRPLRERRPLPTRPRYEPNKITTEKPTRKPVDYSESSTRSSRTRTRGRVHYKPTENEDIYDRRIKSHSKEEDLAYQRDVLHQNYPVTLMERTSTVDIEAITEPAPKISSPKDVEHTTETYVYDTENAYTNEKVSVSEQISETDINENPVLTTRTSEQTSYIKKPPSAHNEEYIYQSRSSVAPVESISYDEVITEREEESNSKQTTPIEKEKSDSVSFATEATSSINEQNVPFYSVVNDEFSSDVIQDETTTATDTEDAKIPNQEENHESEEEENIVQTTPSYNRVRVRPGVIRQYHQASTEASRIKTERKRPMQTVTYRPAYDRRRTTMRIEEIEADLKTKQVHARPEVQDYRHPVYQPEAITEPAATLPTQAASTKRGHFRRRRPSYSTTSTETTRRNTYEVKNRFRGRRPTEKPTEKPEVQTDASTTTVRSPLYTRYSHRPRLSERYNKKTESQETETEDQDSNYSISRPKYAEVEVGQWSPKISTDSFKPYNPNDIVDDQKISTTEHSTDKDTTELDIITAKNEYEDILISVTPATNNRNNKKIPDIPPTLEALVEQSKVTKSDSGDSMSTFESMLEEVMKSLEEQDEDEYTTNVMKHKGGEIGEIPPERIISSGDNYTQKTTVPIQQELTTVETTVDGSALLNENENDRKSHRRGFWKKTKVRPVTTESIEVAESQYYPNTVNMLGQSVNPSKSMLDKSNKPHKSRIAVTTYKPNFQFIKEIFGGDDERLPILDILPNIDIPKLSAKTVQKSQSPSLKEHGEERQTTISTDAKQDIVSPGDFDMGTGSPDPTVDDTYYTTPTTEPTSTKTDNVDRSDGFSFMDYLFGVTSDAGENNRESKNNETTKTTEAVIEITTEQSKSKLVTTESSYIPEEITDLPAAEEDTESVPESIEIKKVSTEKVTDKIVETTKTPMFTMETSSASSFMNPSNIMSTSMSTEVSHETEICFRGKCIKTSKDIL